MDLPPRHNYHLWFLKRCSAVLIQQQFRGFSARKKGLPSLMDSEETETDGSPSLLDSEESKADESSVSSLSTSESIWEKGYHLPEDVTIPSTVAFAKPAIKSNPVTRSSPRQRQAEPPTVDSPTSSVLSPIKKRRLLEDVSAVAERKVCQPEDLLVSNGFKLSVYYTDQPCQVPNCKDPACVFGHTCKCSTHRNIGAVLKGGCFSLFKNGDRTRNCLTKLEHVRISDQRRAEVTSTDSFAFFQARTASFLNSTSHSWNNKPTPAESEVFMLQVVIYQATHPDTPFLVTETSFSDLRIKTDKELKAILEVLKKQFVKLFPDGKGITCFYSGLEVVPLTHAGSAMLSFDQGNPTLKSDDPGQTWLISTWFMNCYKNAMSPVAFHSHMHNLCENYDPDAADAAYGNYMRKGKVEVTKASRLLLAQGTGTFTKNSFDHMKGSEKRTKKRILCGYASIDHVRQHAREMGSICLITGTPYKEGVFGLSLDRSLDDMHHRPEDCLLIGTHLNLAKAAHKAFRTHEALAQHCQENGIDEQASIHAKMCAILRPIIKGMIRRWPKVEVKI